MKKIILLLFLLSLYSCTTLQTLEEKKGAIYTKNYDAPIDTVFKTAKSVARRSRCVASAIEDDELNHKLYAIFRLYGMIPDYVWVIDMQPLSENSTKVDLIWSPHIISEGCFSKDFFQGLDSYLKKGPHNN